MFGSLGFPEILLILVLALLIFGPKRLPEVGRTIGKGLSEFRRASSDLKRTVNAELALDEDERPPTTRRPDLGGPSGTASGPRALPTPGGAPEATSPRTGEIPAPAQADSEPPLESSVVEPPREAAAAARPEPEAASAAEGEAAAEAEAEAEDEPATTAHR